MRRSVSKIIMSHLTGFVFFLILLGVANLLIGTIHNTLYLNIVAFFNSNLILFFAFMLVGMVNDIFWSFYFPFNVLAPVTGSVIGVLVVTLAYLFWNFVNNYLRVSIALPIRSIYTYVFWIVLACGYLIILFRRGKPREVWEERWNNRKWEKRKKELEKKMEKIHRNSEYEIQWSEIGNEFKRALYNLGSTIADLFGGKKRK